MAIINNLFVKLAVTEISKNIVFLSRLLITRSGSYNKPSFKKLTNSKDSTNFIQKHVFTSSLIKSPCRSIVTSTTYLSSKRRQVKKTPYFSHIYRNSFSWLRNKIDFWILKLAWDPYFDEKEFRRGSKQALVTISNLIARKDFRGLQGMVNRTGLAHIDREVHYNFPSEHLHLLSLRKQDIKLILPIRLYFLMNKGNRECDIDVLFVSLRRLEDIYNFNIVNQDATAPHVKTAVEEPVVQIAKELNEKLNAELNEVKCNKQGLAQTDSIQQYDTVKKSDSVNLNVNDAGSVSGRHKVPYTVKKSINTSNDQNNIPIVDANKYNFKDPRNSFRYGFPVEQKIVLGHPRDILFTEMFVRFNRNYNNPLDGEWTVSYFKVTHIELLREKSKNMRT